MENFQWTFHLNIRSQLQNCSTRVFPLAYAFCWSHIYQQSFHHRISGQINVLFRIMCSKPSQNMDVCRSTLFRKGRMWKIFAIDYPSSKESKSTMSDTNYHLHFNSVSCFQEHTRVRIVRPLREASGRPWGGVPGDWRSCTPSATFLLPGTVPFLAATRQVLSLLSVTIASKVIVATKKLLQQSNPRSQWQHVAVRWTNV